MNFYIHLLCNVSPKKRDCVSAFFSEVFKACDMDYKLRAFIFNFFVADT